MGTVYVLRLQDSCFYVGYTEDLEHRLERHRTGKAVSWVKTKGFVECIWSKSDVEKSYEEFVTLKMMGTHGVQNVRGSHWTSSNALSDSNVKSLEKRIKALPQA